MNNWELQMTEAFKQVHMEPSLKEAALKAVSEHRGFTAVSRRLWKKTAVAFCMIALLAAGYGGKKFLEPVSVISIDVNPSIELGINVFDRVVSVEAYNDDGEVLMQDLPLQFQRSMNAVHMVLSTEVVRSCLEEEEAMTLTVVGKNQEQYGSLLNRLENSTHNVKNVYCHGTSSAKVENAHPCGLSYGKYLAYLEAREENPGLTPEQVQKMTMGEILELSGHHGGGNGHHGPAIRETIPPETETAPPEETTIPTEETTAPSEPPSHHGHKKSPHHGGHH